MKRLTDYIKEENEQSALDIYKIYNLVAKYNCHPTKLTESDIIIFEAPDNWNEDDIQQYLQDRFFSYLPGNEKFSDNFFGVNKDNIFDIYFEYEKFEHIDKIGNNIDIKFSSEYSRTKNDSEDLGCFKLTNLKYVIKFEEFDLTNIDDDYNAKEEIIKIFKNAESNSLNNYPLYIKFDAYHIEYQKTQ